MHTLVIERVVFAAKLLPPHLVKHRIGDVVISGDEEEPHIQLVDETQELLPFIFGSLSIIGVAFDQITDGNHELWPEQVQVPHRLHPNPRTMTAGAIRHHGKMESRGIIEDGLVGPRFGLTLDLRQD